jgi:ribosomal protein S18 acetylase RimI-like enzyme
MNEAVPGQFDLDQVNIHLARPCDYGAVRELFYAGVVERLVRPNDTGADIEKLHEGYFADDGESGFWVASLGKEIIGMIGVQRTSDNVAEIRRLRVKDSYRRRGVGARLMQQALRFCQAKGYLKVVLDVQVDRAPAIALFEKFGFKLARTRELEGHKTLDFLLDLYSEPENR